MTAARLIVFDVDGTLIDSQHLILAAMVAAFAAAGHPLPRARGGARRSSASRCHEAMAALAPHLPPTETLALAAHYLEELDRPGGARRATRDAPLYPGALAALERLAGDPVTRLGVATGKAPPRARAGRSRRTTWRSSSSPRRPPTRIPSKPHPSMLLAALAETGCAPERAVMVGDTEYDMAMGRAAGLRHHRRRLGLPSRAPGSRRPAPTW